jgi:hypothetical protein
MRISLTRVLVPAALVALAAFGWSRTQMPGTMGPSPEQKKLEPLVGEWEAKITMHGPMPAESKGVETNRMICGGKWMESVFQGEIMGMPFEGRSLMGWDAEKKAYAGIWIDNMGPAMTSMQGTWSEADKGVVWAYESKDMAGQSGTNRNVETMPDANTRVAKFYFTPEGGAETMTMEIHYKRKGAAKAVEAAGSKSGG